MSKETPIQVASGWQMLPINLALLLGGFTATIFVIAMAGSYYEAGFAWLLLFTIPTAIAGIIALCGHFTLQPNGACALILFGDYRGTVRQSGFYWTNPFMTKLKISLRARNMETQKLKVNDKRGNPIEIAAVVVWRVNDTAQA